MDVTPRSEDGVPLSELTVELIDKAAALAGERISAPIRAAAHRAARILALAGAGLACVIVALVFLGLTAGEALGLVPTESRWWVCLLIAALFSLVGAALVAAALAGPKPEAKKDGETDAE